MMKIGKHQDFSNMFTSYELFTFLFCYTQRPFALFLTVTNLAATAQAIHTAGMTAAFSLLLLPVLSLQEDKETFYPIVSQGSVVQGNALAVFCTIKGITIF